MTEQDKVTVEDIIGIVKTEEQTNSVEEVRKLRGRGNETAKRFTLIECNGNIEDGCTQNVYDGGEDVFELLDLLNSLDEENEQLKIALKDKENLINICEKKFKELGYLITCDDNGYVIE